MTHQDSRSSRQGLAAPSSFCLTPLGCCSHPRHPAQHVHHNSTKHTPTKGRSNPAPTSQPLPFVRAPAFRQSSTRPHQGTGLNGKKIKYIERHNQLSISRAVMEGGTPPAHCSHMSSHASSTNESKAVRFSSSLWRCQLGAVRSHSPEHVAQCVGFSSKADLRVSGPRSTSSCSFALVMWLTTQIHKQLYQHKPRSSKLQHWEQKEPPRMEKELQQLSLLMPMHYAVRSPCFTFHRNPSWSDWQLPHFALQLPEHSSPPGLTLQELCKASNRQQSWCRGEQTHAKRGSHRAGLQQIPWNHKHRLWFHRAALTPLPAYSCGVSPRGWHLRNNQVQNFQGSEVSRELNLAERALYLVQRQGAEHTLLHFGYKALSGEQQFLSNPWSSHLIWKNPCRSSLISTSLTNSSTENFLQKFFLKQTPPYLLPHSAD